MRIAVLGDGASAESRVSALDAICGESVLTHAGVGTFELLGIRQAAEIRTLRPEVVFATGSVPHITLLSELAQKGCHLFLDWPPASSFSLCAALADLAEEAGVELGVSRPLRFARWPESPARLAYIDVLSIRQVIDVQSRGRWKRALEDAVDLALALTRGAAVRRIDAAVARNARRLPLVTSASIRFQNRTFAQIEVRHQPDADDAMCVGVAGPGYAFETNLPAVHEKALQRETSAFLDAIAANRTPPVSVLDALQTIRLMEHLMERLRR